MPLEIQNPRRILAVALSGSQHHLSNVIGKLTGAYPSGALAGTTHELAIDTQYYRAQVPIWLDLVAEEEEKEKEKEENNEKEEKEEQEEKEQKKEQEETEEDDEIVPGPTAWADAFLADEAREVRDALGGVVAVVDVGAEAAAATNAARDAAAQQRDFITHVGRLVSRLGNDGTGADNDDDGDNFGIWDGVGLVVGVSGKPVDDATMLAWDDACVDAGLEFVLAAPGQAANEWGEKTGMERVLEALEANDWAAGADDPFGSDPFGEFQDGGDGARDGGEFSDDDDADPESLDFGIDEADFAGLRQAIWQQQTREVEDDPIESDRNGRNDETHDPNRDHAEAMEKLMRKLQAARMQGELLSPAQRRAMAARVVGEVMDEI